MNIKLVASLIALAACGFGSAGQTTCALKLIDTVVNETCRCLADPADGVKNCRGSGTRVYIYGCEGTCPNNGNCQTDPTRGASLPTSGRAFCFRVGIPADPTCTVDADCFITPYNDMATTVEACKCVCTN